MILAVLPVGVYAVDCESLCTWSSTVITCTGDLACDTIDINNASILLENVTFNRQGADGASCGSNAVAGLGRFNTTIGNLTINNATLDFAGGDGGGGDCSPAGDGAAGYLELRGDNITLSNFTFDSHGGAGGDPTGSCGKNGGEAAIGTFLAVANLTLTFEGQAGFIQSNGGEGGRGLGCGSCAASVGVSRDGQPSSLTFNAPTAIVWESPPNIDGFGGDAGQGDSSVDGGTSNITILTNSSSNLKGSVNWDFHGGRSRAGCDSTDRVGADANVKMYLDLFRVLYASTFNFSGGLPSASGARGLADLEIRASEEIAFFNGGVIDTNSSDSAIPNFNITNTTGIIRLGTFDTDIEFDINVTCGQTGLVYGNGTSGAQNLSFDTSCGTLEEQTLSVYTNPNVSITSPLDNACFTDDVPIVSTISDRDQDIGAIWYQLDSGSNVSVNSSIFSVGTTVGLHTIEVFANDTLNQISSDSVIIDHSVSCEPAGGGGGGGTTIVSNITLDVKPLIIDATHPFYFNVGSANIDLVANTDLSACNVILGEEFTTCVVSEDNIATVIVRGDRDDFFAEEREASVTIRDNFEGAITVPVRVNFVNFGYYVPVSLGFGIPGTDILFKMDSDGDIAGIRVLPPIAVAVFAFFAFNLLPRRRR